MMNNVMAELQDLIEEAKIRTVWWIFCIFGVSYFLSHTSKSMLLNIPIAILLVSGLRMLFNEVEFRWKFRNIRPTSYLSYLEKKQLSVNDSRLSNRPSPKKWKRKLDSPVVEAALEDFVSKILQDFVMDLWYSDITPDREGPQLIHDLIMDVLGEVSGRLKEVNLVDLVTRDAVELIGDHFEIFRRIQSAIGKDVMRTLSTEERDDKLKHHLLASKELHPALISSVCEYKVMQQLTGGLLAVVLRPREVQCPLVRCIAREFLTCLVMQPIMNLASPWYVNKIIEYLMFAYNNDLFNGSTIDPSPELERHNSDNTVPADLGSNDQVPDALLSHEIDDNRGPDSGVSGDVSSSTLQDEPMQQRHGDWAKVFEAATQRRTEVLMPENLENMWAMGIKYKQRLQKKPAPELQASEATSPLSVALPRKDLGPETPKSKPEISFGFEDKASKQLTPRAQQDSQPTDAIDALIRSQDLSKKTFREGGYKIHELETTCERRKKLLRSNSISNSEVRSNLEHIGKVSSVAESLNTDANKVNKIGKSSSTSDMSVQREDPHFQKLGCQVIGAYFEKLGSHSVAVYSISVTDADSNTWIVKRRYRNFERLHRYLKEIPNYTLHLPPKRIFTSSTEDTLVHERCIQLDKYLQELLSIANVAEHIEVWDFLSATSENYSVGKSSSVMTTLAVNVDEAVDDIVRQFKGVSGGLMRMVAGSQPNSPATSRNSSWNADEMNKLTMRQNTSDSLTSLSDNEDGDKDVKPEQQQTEDAVPANSDIDLKEDLFGVPPEWTPPNLSVPVLNLVDNIFQLKRRGWLRRQVFWMSKQILQLVMEDAIDDWLLRQIQWLRREDVIAQGIQWVKDILWPDGTFFLTLCVPSKLKPTEANPGLQNTRPQNGTSGSQPTSFEQHLEAARRASVIRKMIFDGAPTALVSFIGYKQYRRSARDIYYFLQSTICLKQLGYGMLELGLVTIFPELRDVVRDIHEKMLAQQV